MTSWYRTPVQLRLAAWRAYEKSMHEYEEIQRLWREYKARHGGTALNRMTFMGQHTIKDAIEEQQFNERLTILHTAMFEMELAWQKEVRGKLDGDNNHE